MNQRSLAFILAFHMRAFGQQGLYGRYVLTGLRVGLHDCIEEPRALDYYGKGLRVHY